MGLVVGSIIIIWLMVVITAIRARPAQTVGDAEEKSGKRSINDEK